jgi:hypothetical protein
MAQVNVLAALALIAVIGAALTPVLSPYRLAANSQYRLAKIVGGNSDVRAQRQEHIQALRFETGKYGRELLVALAGLKGDGEAQQIAAMAAASIACEGRWSCDVTRTQAALEAIIADMKTFPAGAALDSELSKTLLAELHKSKSEFRLNSPNDSLGVFADLDGDGVDEFAFVTVTNGLLYGRVANGWTLVARDREAGAALAFRRDFDNVDGSDVLVVKQKWRDLKIGSQQYSFQ